MGIRRGVGGRSSPGGRRCARGGRRNYESQEAMRGGGGWRCSGRLRLSPVYWWGRSGGKVAVISVKSLLFLY